MACVFIHQNTSTMMLIYTDYARDPAMSNSGNYLRLQSRMVQGYRIKLIAISDYAADSPSANRSSR